jgi:hypothetical protein
MTRRSQLFKRTLRIACALVLPAFLLATFSVANAATITIVNLDAAGDGLNDPAAATPVGGNSGTTKGAQALIVFEEAASIWGGILGSNVEIRVGSSFAALSCSANSGVLGSAGAQTAHRDFANAPLASTWYPQALANSLADTDLDPASNDIGMQFNGSLGTQGCLESLSWYMGLDAVEPANTISLLSVALHEVGHGLGVASFASLSTGALFNGLPDGYSSNLEDHSTGLLYPAMSNAERVSASTNTGNLHWTGALVVAASGVLTSGVHASGHVEMYAPNPAQQGSSVSHFSTSLTPNELMEPSHTGPDLHPGLAVPLLQDMGWALASGCGDGVLDISEQCDDGNSLSGDCCSSTCTFETSGSPCTDDGDACTADTCDGAGACDHPAAADGTACDDGIACTTGETCQAGVCGSSAPACDDDESCTADTCEVSDCFSTGHGAGCNDPVCEATICALDSYCCNTDWDNICVNGDANFSPGSVNLCAGRENFCANTGSPDGTLCDDGDPATGGDVCTGGVCAGTADLCSGVTCSASDQCHAVGTCDPGTGLCSDPLLANGTPCDDSGACTTSDTCTGGVCAGTATDCSGSSDQCNTGVCNAGSGLCEAQAANEGGGCNDGLFCNAGETCSGGVCGGGGFIDCSGSGDQCNTGTCNETTDACEATPANEGNSCDDGAFCNAGETCSGGVCGGGGATDCSGSGDQCNTGTCNETNNACESVVSNEGGSCDDGDPATANDECAAGVCSGTNLCSAVTCTASDPCHTVGTCDPNTGLCSNPPAGAGTPCGDAGTECTNQDTCDGAGGCTDNGFVAAASACGNSSDTECTNPDTCDGAGACQDNDAVAATNCGDAGTECTNQDTCDGTGGCTDNGFVAAASACGNSSDTECTNPDTCDGAGTCQANDINEGGSCADALFCNGAELCQSGACVSGTAPDCGDGVGCTTDSCNEVTDTCDNTPVDATCDNAQFCDGAETCSATLDCQSGADPCPGQSCNEATDQCLAGPVAMMEARTVAVGGSPVTVVLANLYTSPVVACTVQYDNNNTPVVTRVSAVGSSSFQVRLQNPSGGAVATDNVNCLVVEEGTWTIDGVNIEAQTYLSTVTDRKSNWVGQAQSYGQAYTSPVVIGQVMTENDADWSYFWARGSSRQSPPSATTLNTGKGVAEDTVTNRADETVGFIVFEAGHGTIGGVEFEAGLGTDTVRGINNGPPFSYTYSTAFATVPSVTIASQAAVDGNDGGWVQTFGAAPSSASQLFLSIDEDQIGDAERSHTTEQVGYAVFAGPVVYPSCTEGTPCDDSNACTTGDTCTGGVCAGTATDCSGSGDQCNTGVCNAGSGLCEAQAANEGGGCDDGDPATTNDECAAGMCSGTNLCLAVTCTASDPCHTVGTCDPNTGLCSDPPAGAGTPCGNSSDTECTNPDTCDGAGTCQANDINEGGSCADALFCNGAELCQSGACVSGTAPDCGDGVGCTTDSCNEVTDTCDNTPVDATCDNAQFCDGAETCSATLDCQSGADPCPGQSCNEATDQCLAGPVAMMEARTVAVGGSPVTVVLANLYTSPVVACTVQYDNNNTPVVTRVSAVGSSSFQVRLQNPSGGAVATDNVNCLVVEEGTWTIDGVNIEAQTYLSTVTDRKSNWVGQAQSYGQAYTSPVVIGQVMTENDADWSYFWARGSSRQSPPSATTLNTGKGVAEDTVTNRADETVGFIVFEAGHGTIGGVEFEAGLGTDTVRGTGNSPPYSYTYSTPFASSPTVAVASQSAMDGNDGGWVQTHGATLSSATTLFLSVDEDQISGAERKHTTEQVSYAVFAGSVVYP